MKRILVPVKRVPDYELKIKVNSDGSAIEKDGIKWIVNPFDEIAVEEAVRIKEALSDVEITLISIGPAETTEQLRTGLAMGADQAILIVTDQDQDSWVASQVISNQMEKVEYDLVILGKQAIDSDANQTAQLLASSKGLPQATFASKVEVADDWSSAQVTREVDGGLESIKVELPAVISTDLRLNEPRYPSLPGIVKAKKKPLEEIKYEDLALGLEPRIRITKVSYPEERKAGVVVESVDQLVDKLKNEAKVL